MREVSFISVDSIRHCVSNVRRTGGLQLLHYDMTVSKKFVTVLAGQSETSANGQTSEENRGRIVREVLFLHPSGMLK